MKTWLSFHLASDYCSVTDLKTCQAVFKLFDYLYYLLTAVNVFSPFAVNYVPLPVPCDIHLLVI